MLEIQNLKKYFRVKKKWLRAVDDVSLTLKAKETLGLVGESGSGKSTLGKTIVRLYEPTSGKILFEEKDIFRLQRKELKKVRREMEIIFQDPYSSLNPRMKIRDILLEPLIIHHNGSYEEKCNRVNKLLELTRLPKNALHKYPHEFSGGERQRVGIARAIANNPKFIVCDEPISALDVSIQAQIVNLLQELQSELGLTFLFIAHDLAIIRYISTRVAVMYLGKIVEIAKSKNLFEKPLHPYTEILIGSNPSLDPKKKIQIAIPGEIPSFLKERKGCLFCSRCPRSKPLCKEVTPELKEYEKDRFVACHFPNHS